MTGFDAAAATAHYLQLIDPAREARAIAYTQGSHWMILWGWTVYVATDVLILRLGFLRLVRERVERAGPRPNLAAFLCVTTYILAGSLLHLPWKIYADWVRERSYGLTDEAFGGWFSQTATSAVFTSVFIGLMAIPVYAIIRRTGPRWWAWSGLVVGIGAFMTLVVAPVVLTPLFNETRPAPAGPIRAAIEDLARAAGIPSDGIVVIDGSKQSNRYSATVVGAAGFASIQLSDTMLKGDVDVSQVRAVVAHEMGHYVHYHMVILTLVVALLFTAALWVVHRSFVVLSSPSRRRPLSIEDPSAIPAMHIVFSTFMVLATPVISTAQRWVELEADAYGLDLAREPDGAAKALVRTVDFRASSPGPIEEALFYDHPSIAARVRGAMDWKADHPANGDPAGRSDRDGR
jgi:STE24 endopeptidase